MRVIVEVENSARFHEAELVRVLVESEGMPAGATKDSSVEPPVWLWKYSASTWVRYILRDESTGFLGPKRRRVIILAIGPPPL
jgi:hypothetical protein